MNIHRHTVCLLSLLLLFPSEGSAAIRRYTASASIPIKRSKPSPEETEDATLAVQRALLAKVIAEQDDSRRQKLLGLSSELNPSDFFVTGPPDFRHTS